MSAAPDRAPAIRAVAIGVVLVAVMTAPTITRLTTVGRLDTNDGRFSIWNIAWIGHAILSDDRILDANIFYPHTGTLAYSELNLVAGVLGLPWYAATGNPLAALNGAIFVALVLAFVLMAALVRRLTSSEGAGLVAATAYTFCPYVSSRTAHVQLLMIFVFPLVLLALHRLADRPGWLRGIELGVAMAVAALACGYYGIFAGLSLALMALCLAPRSLRYWQGLSAAAVTTAAIVGPIFWVFQAARARSGALMRDQTLDDALVYSANAAAYLASAAAAHDWWLPYLARWQRWSDVLFPGGILLALTVAGLSVTRRDAATRRFALSYLLLAVLAMWASFGPDAGLYAALYQVMPGASLIRAPARFGIVVVFGLAVVAGFAVARLSSRQRFLPALLVVALIGELGVKTADWGWPSWPLRTVPPLSPAYQKLATLPRGPLVEYQFPYVSSNYHNHAQAMFWSTYHWQPLVNGYSDLIPADFHEIARPINGFPDEASFRIMKERNVRYVLWHVDYYQGRPLQVILERLARYEDNLRPVIQTPDIWLYEIVKWPS